MIKCAHLVLVRPRPFELETLAQNRVGWNETVNKLKSLLLGDKHASLKVTRRETKRTSSKVVAGPGSKWGFGIAR